MVSVSRSLLALMAVLALVLLPRAAKAQLAPTGAKHTLAIDQISGFRASAIGGISYAGPVGISFQRYTSTPFAPNAADDVTRTTTFWITPSADFFVIDHLSIGGLVEFSTTSSSFDTVNGNRTQTFELPTTTSFTLLPRVGYLIGIGERFGIWPRGGIGYASRQITSGGNQNPARETVSGGVVDFDVGFLYRLTSNVFLRAAPEMAFSLGATHSATVPTGTVSANAGVFQFSVVSGIGVFLDL